MRGLCSRIERQGNSVSPTKYEVTETCTTRETDVTGFSQTSDD